MNEQIYADKFTDMSYKDMKDYCSKRCINTFSKTKDQLRSHLIYREEKARWYDLKLGEYFYISGETIISRVPGGWMCASCFGIDSSIVTTFIPFSDEFQYS